MFYKSWVILKDRGGEGMTKSELISQISESCELMTKRQVEFIVNNVFSTIKLALHHDDRVEIRGFGSFRLRDKPAKSGRNPKTGEKIDLSASRIPYFRPGKELKEHLLKNETEIRQKLSDSKSKSKAH